MRPKCGSAPLELLMDVTNDFDNYLGILFEDQTPLTIPFTLIQKDYITHILSKLTWALTIHKFQGMTHSEATIDIRQINNTIDICSYISHDLRSMPPFTTIITRRK